jgi:4-amino-4-deoxy-L-arabinose transferase-like glycosyltransferase
MENSFDPQENLFLPKYFSSKAIAAFFLALVGSNLIFFHRMLPFQWMVFAIIEAVGFFYFTQLLSKRWRWNSVKRFEKRLFTTSLILHAIWVVFAYFFYIWMSGQPFEFAAADSHGYVATGLQFANIIKNGQFFSIFGDQHMDVSDMGFPLWLSFLDLTIGPSLLVQRLIHAIFSAWTAVLLYRLTTRNFGESAGRLAGIMFMLLPNFYFYVGIHLKETMMIFLVVAFANNADQLLRGSKLQVKSLVLTIAILLLFFLFRTALGITAIFALMTALIFSKGQNIKKWGKRVIIAVWLIAAIGVFLSARMANEIEELYQYRNADQSTSMKWRAQEQGGNPYAKYGTMALFVPMILTLPFPTFTLANEEQQNQMMFSGGYFDRNVYSFFVILALFLLIKRHEWREHLFIITFFGTYLLIIAKSAFAVSERFHLPAVPFLLAMAAYGMTQAGKKERKWYIPFLVLIVFAAIGWNWFKLAGRGLG